ncbi:hypothetical protein [Hymenobacter properus]|uniref:Uncharacterized protein n=1 Tax=Hymenobacter properus TaxID=2791026 RepID=A0A931BK96_9BACT|nr:hypothetical protein [Hymenobacter properus]MBF9144111.1 hypothetical protein [Hymenobacter properus]MBR7722927.1 hypothetical protein [Microvirga sp. SRT04]
MRTNQQRKYDILASNALFLQSAFSVIGNIMMGAFITKDGSWGYPPFTKAQFMFFYPLSILLVLGHAYCVRRGYLWAKLLKLGSSLIWAFRIASNIKAMSILNIHGFWEGVTAISQFALAITADILIIISLKIQIEAAKRVVE